MNKDNKGDMTVNKGKIQALVEIKNNLTKALGEAVKQLELMNETLIEITKPKPEQDCWSRKEREDVITGKAYTLRTKNMIEKGFSPAMVRATIENNPDSVAYKALMKFAESLPPECGTSENRGGGGDDGNSNDNSNGNGGSSNNHIILDGTPPSTWPELSKSHAESVLRYCLHAVVRYNVLPPHIGQYPAEAAKTPNQSFLWLVDNWVRVVARQETPYTLTPAAQALNQRLLGTNHFMGAEQGGYRKFHLEAALCAMVLAKRFGIEGVYNNAKSWLSTYCAYVDLHTVNGVSYIPGPRIGTEWGMDGWRDLCVLILTKTKKIRGLPELHIEKSDAALALANMVHGEVEFRRGVDLPGVLSLLEVTIHENGVISRIRKLVKSAGGPVWAVAVNKFGERNMVSWRDLGYTKWKEVKEWGGRGLVMPRELKIPSNMGRVKERWLLDQDGARRLQ